MADTYSPVLHRLDQAVRWRAVHPTKPVPPPYEILIRYSKPPEELVTKSKRRLEKLVTTASVKKGEMSSISIRPTTLLTAFSPTKSPIPKA